MKKDKNKLFKIYKTIGKPYSVYSIKTLTRYILFPSPEYHSDNI